MMHGKHIEQDYKSNFIDVNANANANRKVNGEMLSIEITFNSVEENELERERASKSLSTP